MKFTAMLRLALLAACGMMCAWQAAAGEAGGIEEKKPDAAIPAGGGTVTLAAGHSGRHGHPGREAGKPAAKEAVEPISWSSSLIAGYRRALADRKPLLIVVAAKWCAPCRKLAGELATAAVQAELARWTPVRLDLDAQADDAGELAVVGVPALRIRSADGQPVAERDGYLAADELLDWLKNNYDAATAAADNVLLDSGEPSVMAVVRLVKQFEQRNPALREAAIRRLLPYPGVARPVVFKTFREGSLAARLAALEVLEQWKAPLAGLDPWRPETFTPERLAPLAQWTERNVGGEQGPPQQLSQEQLAAARRQIERMLMADEGEADAIRQRLAGWGAALLPEVYTRLKGAATDQDRRRLSILRYRLAAPDSLVLAWPGGLERLADADPRQRRKAADELAKLAGDAEKSLLLELFADPDPLVREISLRGLQHIGGQAANAELVKLLSDPEPNVRAAVLKQLEETPDNAMVPAVVKYLQQEKDPDLIVHGICFLRATNSSKAIQCLMSLLKHPSWQVRAEAAVGIGKLNEGLNSESPTTLQVDAYVALLQLLDDSDAFVVAKAVEGLSHADLAVAVAPLVKVAGQHPDLAPEVLAMLSGQGNMSQKAIPDLRRFCKHPQPRVRAAAVAALATAAPNDAVEELAAALGDKASEVRLVATSSLFERFDMLRRTAIQEALRGSPGELAVAALAGVDKPAMSFRLRLAGDLTPATESKAHGIQRTDGKGKSGGAAKAEEELNLQDQWLQQCYAGRGRPKWTAQMAAPLEKLLQKGDAKDRIAAALVLVPLGKAAAAGPVLRETARANPDLMDQARQVLSWLPWEQRLKMFQDLYAMAASGEARAGLIGALSEVPDRRMAGPAWELLSRAKLTTEEANALRQALLMAYLGNRYSSSDQSSPADRRDLARAAKPRTSAGSDWQRLVALTLLANAAPDEAAQCAAGLAGDPKLSASLRIEAFDIQFLLQSDEQARKTAAAALKGTDAARKRIAIRNLVLERDDLPTLPSGFYLYDLARNRHESRRREGTPIVPRPPAGVAVEDVRPLAGDSDPEAAACAGYVLVLLGESDGMARLLQHWRQHEGGSDEWDKLVYRAIAVLDDPKYIPVLRQIHNKIAEAQYDLTEFYWTIRIMSGPEILKLRKQIRQEIAASQSRL